MMKFGTAALLLLTLPAAGAMATPAVMVQAKDCTVLVGGTSNGPCTPTHNQAGLTPGYIDEVTSLHPYVAAASHTPVFSGFEWFGDSGTTTGEVSYFVDAIRVAYIDHFVLWNEEVSGIGVFNLWYGMFAGDKLDLVLTRVSPFDNPAGAAYMGEFWEFAPRPKTGWWTLEMSDCPQPNPGGFPSCAIGEVAWGGNVPEPATWAMLIAGFGLVGYAARRRRAFGVHSA